MSKLHRITAETLHWLICLSENADLGRRPLSEIAPELSDHGWLNRLTPAAWREAAEALPTEALERLIRLFTLAEREFRWVGGSVAAVIWLYCVLEERDRARARVTADWVLANRGTNEFVPFGTRTSAVNRDAFLVEERRREVRRRARIALQKQERRIAEERRQDRADAHEGRCRESRSRAARRRWQIEFLQLQPCGISLSDAVHQWPLPLEAFPLELIPDLDAAAEGLDHETRDVLTMMIGRRGGAWRRLRRKLERLDRDERRFPGLH